MTRILIIEDDEDLRATLADDLEGVGFIVTSAADAAGFRAAVAGADYDIAILDATLPDGDGFDLASVLAEGKTGIGVVMLTGRDAVSDRIRGYQSGADLYFTKPVITAELVAAVRRLASRRAPEGLRPAPADGAAWMLDCARWRLQSPEGATIALTEKEMLLLRILIGQAGRTVSRGTLLQQLGYEPEDRQSRSLDMLLNRLRRKIEQETGQTAPIRTVQAVGLAFHDRARITH